MCIRDSFGIDVLTDTTERSPTYCTPPFRKFDDDTATESWAFLFLPDNWTDVAWQNILKRKPRCVEWREDEIRKLVTEEKVPQTLATVRKILSLIHISGNRLCWARSRAMRIWPGPWRRSVLQAA